jgi:GT2 family glycosyltransferase
MRSSLDPSDGKTPPLDYAAERASLAGGGGPCEIVIPIHGAADDLRECLASVVASTDLRQHRIVAVLDGAGQDRCVALVEESRRQGAAVLMIEQPERRGFVAGINRGVSVSTRDVVLLNSDTVVTHGWLERLQAAACSAPAIATVTPFSNNGSLCSIVMPPGFDIQRFGEIVTRVARRSYPRIPNGVGFCLYVKRAALDALGGFDETVFGQGYGEEVDFCVRAVKSGYVNVLDDATFVYHAGGRSFGPSATARARAGLQTVVQRHPEYWPTLQAFFLARPLDAARRHVDEAVAALGSAPSPPHT